MTDEVKDEKVRIKRIETSPFATNAYIVVCRATQDCVLIDAPGEALKILEFLKKTNPRYILITHNHMDHTEALQELKARLNIPVAAHPSDAQRLPVSCEVSLNDGDVIAFGKTELKMLHTPGHTPGSVCFLKDKYLLSGDTLFPGGPGKTNTPEAFKQIIDSLKKKIFILPDDVLIFPGHGESTVLGKEKEEFSVFSSRPHSPNLFGDVLWLQS